MRYLMTGLTLVAALTSLPALADELGAQVARCAAEPSDLARLICYDEMARDLELSHAHLRTDPAFASPRPAVQTRSPASEPGVIHGRGKALGEQAAVAVWDMIEVDSGERKEMNLVNSAVVDDRMARVLSLDAHPDARLVVQCLSGQWTVFIDWDRSLGRGTGSVALEWDGQARERFPVRISSLTWGGTSRGDRSTVFNDAVGLVQRLLAHRQLTASAQDKDETNLAARFDLSGLSEAIGPLVEACGAPR